MRISCDQGDAGYLIWRNMKNRTAVKVFVDEVEQRDVVTADDETGIVVVLVRDGDGKLVLTPELNAVKRLELRGKVRIEYAS